MIKIIDLGKETEKNLRKFVYSYAKISVFTNLEDKLTIKQFNKKIKECKNPIKKYYLKKDQQFYIKKRTIEEASRTSHSMLCAKKSADLSYII